MSNGCGNGHVNLPNGTWRQACVDHDHAYYDGGSWQTRLKADVKLGVDMYQQGAPLPLAALYTGGAYKLGSGLWGHGTPANPGSH